MLGEELGRRVDLPRPNAKLELERPPSTTHIGQSVDGICPAPRVISEQRRVEREGGACPTNRRDRQSVVSETVYSLDIGPMVLPAAVDQYGLDGVTTLGRLDRRVLADQRRDLAPIAAGQGPVRLLADESPRERSARARFRQRG